MASNSSGRTPQEEEDADDDFGDFGGFEGAESGPDMSAPQGQATASPWAVFSTGNAAGRPDLLCAQNRFPTYLDPSNIAGASGGLANHNVNNLEAAAPAPQADLLNVQNDASLNQARIAENVLDGTLNAGVAAGFAQNVGLANGRLPDIGLGLHENQLFGQIQPDGGGGGGGGGQAAPNPGDDAPPLELPAEEDPASGARPVVEERGGEGQDVAAGQDAPRVLEPDANVVQGANAAEASNEQESALQEQLNTLLERNQMLEEELRRVQEDLATQRSRLQEVESRHAAELESVRQAGHDALTIVVDQYKEQSRAVVLEQQEVCQRRLVETLAQQTESFQGLLQTQEETHAREVERERSELGRRIDKALEEAQQQQQERFDAFLLEEQERQRNAVEKTVEEERCASQRAITEAVNAEQERGITRLEEVRMEYSQLLEDERRSHEAALRAVREEEKERAKEQMEDLVREERERGREAVRNALDASREDTRAYIDEQRQVDSRVRQRHLTSLDLFLESARQQIALLLDQEKPASASASASSSHPSMPGSSDKHRKDAGDS